RVPEGGKREHVREEDASEPLLVVRPRVRGRARDGAGSGDRDARGDQDGPDQGGARGHRVRRQGPSRGIPAVTLGSTKALVNDLDLEVTAPDGTVHRGNHFAPFAQAESLPDGSFDTTNVEEAVIRKSAIAGDWTVRVIGSNIPVGPQPFALVATGAVDPSYGRVRFDRPAYSEGDTVRITVEDSSATSVVVHVTSGIESAGENVTLVGGGPEEVWRGSI